MKINGQVRVKAPRAAVYEALRDARFFASCVEGVQDLTEIAPDRYSATLETKVAYMSFKFKVTVELVRAEPPREIEAKVEGTPLGINDIKMHLFRFCEAILPFFPLTIQVLDFCCICLDIDSGDVRRD